MKLLKTLGILLLVVGLLLGAVSPVLAAGRNVTDQPAASFRPDKDEGKVKVIRGVVVSVNITDKSIFVDSKKILTDNKTKYKVPGLGKEASLTDIEVGMQIVVSGHEKDGKFYARQIVVVPGKPISRHHVGRVTAYSYNATAGGSITIRDKHDDDDDEDAGKSFTFEIIGGQFKILPAGATVNIGDWVTVISHRVPATDRLIASGVVGHPPKPDSHLRRISGNITNITDNATSKTITVGTTVLNWNGETVFILRGVPAIRIGQEVTVFYRAQDSALLAKWVLVGINLSEALDGIGKGKFDEDDD